MPSDYEAIKRDNIKRYGTDIHRIGKMLLADRYDDRTHFIYELLQNTEDALGRCAKNPNSRKVEFKLEVNELRLTHFGEQFSEKDVKGVCGIAESTKSENELGRFGIGFKSVYTFTDNPEIHSGDEHFAVEHYVKPKSVNKLALENNQTLIKLPLKQDDQGAIQDISHGLNQLGARSLLFLNQIEEISWSLPDGGSGIILRSTPDKLAANVRKITLSEQKEAKEVMGQAWLVFNRKICSKDSSKTGQLELAFSIAQEDNSSKWLIRPVKHSPLVVYFPTALLTNLGFLLQGPFRTTPSRDNIPKANDWNKQLINETGILLAESLRWLRDNDLLTTATLECLPLDKSGFSEDSLFKPIYDAIVKLLADEKLLPTNDMGFTSATQAKLARTKELRILFNPHQLGQLFESEDPLYWLAGDITADREPTLRRYCMAELGIQEVTPELILTLLDKNFLEAQSDEWILQFYQFLESQSSLHEKLKKIEFVRLENGHHVLPTIDGQPQAFIAGKAKTDLPTVRKTLTQEKMVLNFLGKFGITVPDPVDDVVQMVLPKYAGIKNNVSDEKYASDIKRIVLAFGTDSNRQRDKLIAALKETWFVKAIDAEDNSKFFAKPTEVHLATESLRSLLAGVNELCLVDVNCDCLKGKPITDLLEICGAVRHLRPIDTEGRFLSEKERKEIREKDGRGHTSGINDQIKDHSLEGLDKLLQLLPQLDNEERSNRSKLIWQNLIDLERRRSGIFQSEYRWSYHGHSNAKFEAHFIRLLKNSCWVASNDGKLCEPRSVLFDSLGWPDNPFLQRQIEFRPPAIDKLAKETGIEPDVLILLKKHGLTNVEALLSRLGVGEESEPDAYVYGDASDLPEMQAPEGSTSEEVQDSIGEHLYDEESADVGNRNSNKASRDSSNGYQSDTSKGGTKGKRSANSGGGRPFISYLGAEPEEQEGDPDGLDHESRIRLENQAIELIIANERNLKRTPTNNPGFDLIECSDTDEPIRWIEVKAMTGTLRTRSVGLSKRQFEFAREMKSKYWLYIVENAGKEKTARILRIQDPVTKTRTFTFDRGWAEFALTNSKPD